MDSQQKQSSFTFSLRTLMLGLVCAGVITGILGRAYFNHYQLFLAAVSLLSTVIPYLLAIGTIVALGARARNRGLVVWGIILFCIPFLGFGIMAVAQYANGPAPGGLGVKTNQQLLAQLPNQIDEPWVWDELERRLNSGKLSSKETEKAIDKLIVFMKETNPDGWNQPLSWQDDFIEAASVSGALSPEKQIELADAFYGSAPSLELPRIREGKQRLDLAMEYGNSWDDNSGIYATLVWDVKRVLVDGKSIDLREAKRFNSDWRMSHQAEFTPGDIPIEIELEVAYVDRTKLVGLDVNKIPASRWPKALKRWQKTVKGTLKVYKTTDQIIPMESPSNCNPKNLIRIKRLVAQVDHDGKRKIILETQIEQGLQIPISFDVDLDFGDQIVPLGQLWAIETQSMRSSNGRTKNGRVNWLDADIESADIVLTPNPSHVEQRPDVERIWGKEIKIRNVPIERLDLETESESRR